MMFSVVKLLLYDTIPLYFLTFDVLPCKSRHMSAWVDCTCLIHSCTCLIYRVVKSH